MINALRAPGLQSEVNACVLWPPCKPNGRFACPRLEEEFSVYGPADLQAVDGGKSTGYEGTLLLHKAHVYYADAQQSSLECAPRTCHDRYLPRYLATATLCAFFSGTRVQFSAHFRRRGRVGCCDLLLACSLAA